MDKKKSVLSKPVVNAIIRAVVFDLGGVMVADAHTPMLRKLVLSKWSEYSEPEFKKLFETSKAAWKFLEVKQITEMEFWARIIDASCLLKGETTTTLASRLRKERLIPFYRMFGLAARLRDTRTVTGLLTNYCEEWFVDLWQKFQLEQLFNRNLAITSFDVKAAKPDPKIYRHLESVLWLNHQIKPEQTFFIDDKIENVDAAKKLGFQGMVFDSRKDWFMNLENAVRMA